MAPCGLDAVFLDRDGVISRNRAEHVCRWAEFEFLPGALEGLALLSGAARWVIVVTNQAIVGRGLATRATVDGIHRRMGRAARARGGRIDRVMVCPHRPEDGCACRKPAPGLLLEAAASLGIGLDRALLIGDHAHDLEAARRAGCRSILVLSGRTGVAPDPLPEGCVAALPDLLAAARWLSLSALSARSPGPPPNRGNAPARWSQ